MPLWTHPIEHARHFDVMGESSEVLSAPMSEADFRRFVRALGLSRSTGSHALSGAFGRPEWFRPPADAELWVDRETAAQSNREVWCWTMAAWDGRTVFASTGCGWL
jgi:hypothetical protein